MAFSNHISDEDKEHLYALGKAAEAGQAEGIPDIIHFLEEQRRSAVADLHAHQEAHRGPFAGTIPCFMDHKGTCHGIGEQIAENADKAIEAHINAIARYAVNRR